MGRKVFISILGTGAYKECVYEIGDFKCKTRFIQEATMKYLINDLPEKGKADKWGPNDKACIFVTKGDTGSEKLNWNTFKDEIRIDKNNKGEERTTPNYKGLGKVLENIVFPLKPYSIQIDDGLTTERMWSAFSTIYDEIEDGDELYIDLTHGFRYLPMLLLVLCNYAKFLKNVTVKSVTYGNFEFPSPDGTHPIMDLMPLVELQDWTYAAANFVNNGVAQDLTTISDEYGRIEKKRAIEERKRNEATANSVNKGGANDPTSKDDRAGQADTTISFSKKLQTFVDDMNFCRGNKLLEQENSDLNSLQQNLDKIKETGSVIPLLNPVIDKISEKYQPLFNNDNIYVRLFSIAELCYDNGQYQAAATILQEAVITYFCIYFGLDKDEEEQRNLFGNAVYKYQNPTGCKTKNPEIVDKILADDLFSGIVKEYQNLSKLRNDFNHSGMVDSARKSINMKSNLSEYIQFFKENLTADKLEKK
jgi:CRISPR-associated Csx2 family protein